jgi:hypothetical protein
VGRLPSVAMQRRQHSARSAEWGSPECLQRNRREIFKVPSPAREGIEMTKQNPNHRFIFAMQSFNDSPWKKQA